MWIEPKHGKLEKRFQFAEHGMLVEWVAPKERDSDYANIFECQPHLGRFIRISRIWGMTELLPQQRS